MTIGKGETWGSTVERPAELTLVADDAALADVLAAGVEHVALQGGDMFATVGGRAVGDRRELLRLPLDLLHVAVDDEQARAAVAHVVIRCPWWRGGPFRGPVVVVMNAEFLDGVPMAPRGHPNDGRVEVLEFEPTLRLRQRLAIRRRARSAAHLPHPGIRTRSVRTASWSFDRPMVVVADGVVLGSARRVSVDVVADAGQLLT